MAVNPPEDGLPSAAELGRHLMQVRERGGVKQAELAREGSLSQAELSRIERGERALGRGAALLLKREHQMALIGSIAVRKSTPLCRMSGYTVSADDPIRLPVLEV